MEVLRICKSLLAALSELGVKVLAGLTLKSYLLTQDKTTIKTFI